MVVFVCGVLVGGREGGGAIKEFFTWIEVFLVRWKVGGGAVGFNSSLDSDLLFNPIVSR
jgi:hypothetical protein